MRYEEEQITSTLDELRRYQETGQSEMFGVAKDDSDEEIEITLLDEVEIDTFDDSDAPTSGVEARPVSAEQAFLGQLAMQGIIELSMVKAEIRELEETINTLPDGCEGPIVLTAVGRDGGGREAPLCESPQLETSDDGDIVKLLRLQAEGEVETFEGLFVKRTPPPAETT